MSGRASSVADVAEAALVRACWRQWASLKGEHGGRAEDPARSIIDPEALVLASLAVRHRERRLADCLSWWLPRGAHLLSVQRFKTLAAAYPTDLAEGIAWFAGLAVESGDARWSRLLAADRVAEPVRPGKGPEQLTLREPATLMLRLRAGFGVSAKADVLTFLLGAGLLGAGLSGAGLSSAEAAATHATHAPWVRVPDIATATAYSPASVRRAAADMALAGLIEATSDDAASRSMEYSLDRLAWARLLDLRDPGDMHRADGADAETFHLPAWAHAAQVFAFLAQCATWGRQVADAKAAPVVAASRARDLVESHRRILRIHHWPVPRAEAAPGERFLDPFEALVRHAVGWVDAHL